MSTIFFTNFSAHMADNVSKCSLQMPTLESASSIQIFTSRLKLRFLYFLISFSSNATTCCMRFLFVQHIILSISSSSSSEVIRANTLSTIILRFPSRVIVFAVHDNVLGLSLVSVSTSSSDDEQLSTSCAMRFWVCLLRSLVLLVNIMFKSLLLLMMKVLFHLLIRSVILRVFPLCAGN